MSPYLPDFASLPIDDVLEALSHHLDQHSRLVLAAPPGAGKTTRVPLELLKSAWLETGKLILVEPRRIAARRAAERMAGNLGEKIGQTIGLRSRLDTRVSKATRIEVVTDGVFSNQIIREPDLPGIAGVIFDEFHERGLEADLGLTLALETQEALRDDLRLIVMSATLDTASLCTFMQCDLIESEGRAFPVETIYQGRTRDPIEDQMAKAIKTALASQSGSVLAFLPGAGEIRRTAERLDDLGKDIEICPLFGALSPKEQDAAIAPAPPGRRKIVLATDIAESSLTIEGVRIVVDAGLARVPVFRPGMMSGGLETRRASIANVDQRRGRAGRTEPGVCYRLWNEEENRGLPKSPEPEILATDLSALTLRLAAWGEADPLRLSWLTPPPKGQIEGAKTELKRLDFVDDQGRLSEEGRKASALPMSPRLAKLITAARNDDERTLGAYIAALLSEPGLLRGENDLTRALSTFRSDKSPRAEALKKQADKWAGRQNRLNIDMAGPYLARVWPDRIVRLRPNAPLRYQASNGGGYRLMEGSPFAGQTWLVVADAGGHTASDPIIRLAAEISEQLVKTIIPISRKTITDFDPGDLSFRSREVQMIGEIALSERPLQKPDRKAIGESVLAYIAANGFENLEARLAVQAFICRYELARHHASAADWSELTETGLASSADDWLGPDLQSKGVDALKPEAIQRSLLASLDWSVKSELDRLAPLSHALPSGRKVAIEYEGEQAPLISARVQDFYGLKSHPSILAGQKPLTISLLSPAQRPVAITRDLPGFWAGGYGDMRKDMKGRYPKHDWPEDPANAAPRRPGEKRNRS